MREPAGELRIRLSPGDLLIMENNRALHGRTAFDPNLGRRHLQGCYVDKDGVESRRRVLQRRCRMSKTKQQIVDEIVDLYARKGELPAMARASRMNEHGLQAALLAEQEGQAPAMIVAALLHDIGHLLHELPEDIADQGVDTQHESLASAWLSQYFPKEVSEPVRLHVAAKRFLCANVPGYLADLSPASVQSLELQGGQMSPAEIGSLPGRALHGGGGAAAPLGRSRQDARPENAGFSPLRRSHCGACAC